MDVVYLNGEFLPREEAKISVFDRGFLFADAVYEVISVLDGGLIDFDYHLARLKRSLWALEIMSSRDFPFDSASYWKAICFALISRHRVDEGLIYIQISAGGGHNRQFLRGKANTPTVMASIDHAILVENPIAKRGMRIILRDDLRWLRGDIKTTQLLYATMVKREAKARNVDDCWLVRGGLITEGSTQNAHIIDKEGRLHTHPLNMLILHGVTRHTMLKNAHKMGLEIVEKGFTKEQLYKAKEAFITSSSLFVMPVVEVDGSPIGDGKPGALTVKLRDIYINVSRHSAAQTTRM